MRRLLVPLLSLLLCACASRPDVTLYQSLGESPGLERLVDQLLIEFATDERVAPSFRHTEIERFRRLFIEHLCELADGPCRYSGESMRAAHAHLEIDEALFNAVVEDLQRAMNTVGYSQPTQNELLRRLAKLRAEILSDGTPLPSRLIEDAEP